MNHHLAHLCTPLLGAALISCSAPPTYRAEVELAIEGKSFDYVTTHAQIDQQREGGRYSVYLLPGPDRPDQPYLCLRAYLGNPVAELWVRYDDPAADAEPSDDDLGRYDCFVPGTLADGRPTLGWTEDDGRPRDRTVTGEERCQASVRNEGNLLYLAFDAIARRKARAKKKGDGSAEDAPREAITVVGKAVLNL